MLVAIIKFMTADTIHLKSDSIMLGQKTVVQLNDTICHAITIIQKNADPSLFDKIIENGITILLALIAGLVALYQVKSNIVSSARIKWIEELRHEISQLYNDSLSTILYWGNFTKTKAAEDYNKYDLAHSNFFILSNRIRMKLNLTEEGHSNLNDRLNEIESMLEAENIETHSQEDVEVILKQIVVISRQIFKLEWDKSKKVFKI